MVSDMQLGLVTVDNETIVDHETICGLFVRLFVPLGEWPLRDYQPDHLFS